VVFKPSEQTPAVGQFLMQIYADAGFPNGVVNMVQGARDCGAALLGHRELDGVLFTGSARTGAMIHKQFGGRPEIVLALEMGGNNPLIAWDVEDAQAAASIITQSAFITTGQRCTCARRLIVPSGKAGDAIVDALVANVDAISIGAWDEGEAFMGPLISAGIAGFVASSAAKLGGKTVRAGGAHARGGAFIKPVILDVTGMNVPDEEIFGPVLQITRASDFDHAMQAANATRFGLAAGLISSNADLWTPFARGIRAGVVNFNRPTTGASGALPFGGPGASGNHNPGAYYAADFCAWPMASQISDTLDFVPSKGIK
jgi:succinylglutamic semialdehyde dehydrogenase